jgi:type III pantothenate kinase
VSALLLDVGNSRVKWGVLDDGEIRRTGQISQHDIRQQGLAMLTTKLPRRVDVVYASNVAGTSFATRLSGVIGMHCNLDIRFARSEKRGWGLTNSYRQVRRLGVDRWVAMIGAWTEVRSTCLVVDAGTAVTIDAIDDDGVHLGGQIIPGMETMLNSLSAATSDVPLVRASGKNVHGELKMFGRNTSAAVREGAENAITGAVERAYRTLIGSNSDPTIVLTGGGAARILGALEQPAIHSPHLVLHGLAHMLENPR